MGHFAIDESNGVKTLEIEKDRNSYDIMIMMAYKRSTVQFFFFFFGKRVTTFSIGLGSAKS